MFIESAFVCSVKLRGQEIPNFHLIFFVKFICVRALKHLSRVIYADKENSKLPLFSLIAFYLRHIYITFTYQNRLIEVVIVLNFTYNPTENFQYFSALSLVVSNLRSKTKRFQFESGC